MSFLTDLLTLLQTATAPAPITPGDAGIGGRVGGDSSGVLPGGGTHAGGGPQTAPGGGSGGSAGQRWIDPTTGETGTGDAGLFSPLTGIWQQITAGAPVVGVYALLALLFLIGVVGLVVSSGAGQAAVGAVTGEVGAAAAGATGAAGRRMGRAAARRVIRKKPP